MSSEEVVLSLRELDRAGVIRDVVEKRLPQREAALRLDLSVRQVKRLASRYRGGAAGLASVRRGKRSSNAIDPAVRRSALALVRERYPNFGPTFAREKLVEAHGYRLSAEMLRGWMIEDGLWRPEARRGARAHLAARGRPAAYYSDRCGVFQVNRRGREDAPTQFARALRTLDIAPIHAGSPQAKGRAERANRTLQDRLVKELRLRGICGIEAGNAFLPAFMADYNRRFGAAPRNASDAHRAVLHDARELDLILCEQHVRKLTRNLSISFQGRTYQVTGQGRGYRLRGAAVTVCKGYDGAVTVLRDGRELPVELLAEGEEPAPVEDGKGVRSRVDRAKARQQSRPAWKPPPDHPWRRPFRTDAQAVAR